MLAVAGEQPDAVALALRQDAKAVVRRCDVCGGAAEVEPETLQRWSSEHHSAR